MKKIILDCDLMKYPNSGLYHYCLNLGNYVSDVLQKEGNESLSFYIPSNAKNVFAKNEIVEKKWHHKFFKPFLFDCDLWHAPFQSGRVLPKNKKTKVLLTIHDLNCLHENKTEKERRDSLAKTQKLIDNSTVLVCISHHCKKDVLENLDIGNKPIYVIHNGTHQVVAAPLMPTTYRPNKPFVFAMGYVNEKKNFHTLVPLLQNENIDLVIAGKLDEPDYVTKIERLAKTYNATDRLKILGPVNEQDKAWYLKNCMAFSLPSLAEGFGAPVVEAMAFGKPLFLSNKTSLPEIGGDVAFYFENFNPHHVNNVFAKGMEEYNKNGLANKIVERGKQFEWKQKAEEYVALYRSLLY
ncbi:MAG: glycosyltransferase family 4 protein [Ferruginibacter sp.]|nr:glycosyltransferase family 4 protein [Ferruginibacter sp.]